MSLPELEEFLSWFQSNGGRIDLDAVGFKYFPSTEGGRGAVALKNIEKDQTLFAIPRPLTLSTKTSLLPEKFGPRAWKEHKLDKGWSGLILCMMWEDAQTFNSKWRCYLATLPTAFDTPMFWSEKDLKELEGTSVVEKLGKEDAERDYHDKVFRAIQSRPDLFPPETLSNHYSLERYHVMGSRILSRSFGVERVDIDGGDDGEEMNPEADKSIGSAMDVDEHDETTGVEDTSIQDDSPSEDGDEGEEDAIDISMVPIADLLNARFGSENAKLFYEEKELKMVTTKRILAGEQIWNTYDDLPNSELLRRYGHVDILPLPGSGKGNPADVVEIRADLVLATFSQQSESTSSTERIDWWLEEGGDDTFVLGTDYEVPEAMVSLTRLLYLSSDEWEKAQEKSKPPKPKLDSQALNLILVVLQKRIAQYPSTMKDDEEILKQEPGMPLNKYQAIFVRLGEKRILENTLQRLVTAGKARGGGTHKRKSAPAFDGSNQSTKKAKR
ncbi:SET domain-containing protein [Lentinula edodes]|uniref:SET domain-containing protein n=1 Tax=Lentinula edodes TaxID=5353 RepID=UPI001E8EC210|nr:SET domain-containing protein [Lentinula edodes]KAH7876558.1 SET domain-containing protein [Lentinula edodes]